MRNVEIGNRVKTHLTGRTYRNQLGERNGDGRVPIHLLSMGCISASLLLGGGLAERTSLRIMPCNVITPAF